MNNSSNYFTLFALPVSFDIDPAELTSRYLKLQKAVHPDKFASASEQERLYSVQKTAELNDAYETLKKPLLRARHLLVLSGVQIDDEQNTIMDPGFLMQQMELRETIGEAKQSSNIDALEATIDHIDELYNIKLKNIQTLFADTEPKFDQIADIVRKLQFFNKLREETDVLMAQIENNKE